MKENYIVRADFYPDGSILPLGITDTSGNTHYIDYVKMPANKKQDSLYFNCRIHNKDIGLRLTKNRWEIEEIKD